MNKKIKNIVMMIILFSSLYASSTKQKNWVPIAIDDILTFVPKGIDSSGDHHNNGVKDYNQNGDINRWYVYANSQKNALSKVYDSMLKKNVVSLKTSNGKSIAMQLGNHWNDSKSVISWEQKIKGKYIVYLQINTTKGKRYMVYQENVEDSGLHDTYYLNIGLPAATNNSWKTITRDIKADLKRVESDNTFLRVDRFLVRVYDDARLGSIVLKETGGTHTNTLPIVIIGPSTVYIDHEVNGDKYYSNDGVCRLEGWGERLYDYASSPNDIYNYARPGSNATSFMESPAGKSLEVQTLYGPNRDHYWAKTKDKMRQLGGGILLIQYGANEPDADENDFKTSIRTYIDEAKELNFTPILITEIEKRIRNQDGTLWRARGDYPKWMKELAEENNLRLLDLNKKSYEEYRKLNNKQWHNQFADCYNEWAVNYLVSEKGYTRENAKIEAWENTHFEVKGAKIVASWIRDLACEQKNSKICKLLNRNPKSFSLSSNRFIPANGSPALSWSNIPKGTKSFAVIIDDYDAKDGSLNWVHWSIFNIGRHTHSITAKNTPRGALVELNSNGSRSYADPVFPNEHKYVAHIYALDIADITKAVRFKDHSIYRENQKYDHVEFEKIYGNFILDKSEIRSK